MSVHDGDTFTVDIAGWPPVVGHHISVRIAGIDCPEISDHRPLIRAKAQQAKTLTETALQRARLIELRDLRRDKYFRLLADVYLDGDHLADKLLAAELAHKYEGKTKQPW